MGSQAVCKGDFEEDLVGLRQPPGGDCTFFAQPNFGMVEVDWESRIAKLQVRCCLNFQIACVASVHQLPCLTGTAL